MNEEMTDPLVRQISELRAALGDSEARRAELEAVIEKVRERLVTLQTNSIRGGWASRAAESILRDCLSTTRSVVLEDRDRENRAIGWDEGVTAAHDRLVKRVDTEGLIDQHALIKRPANPYRGDNR